MSDSYLLYKHREDIRYILSKYPDCREKKDAFKALKQLDSAIHKLELVSKNNIPDKPNNDEL